MAHLFIFIHNGGIWKVLYSTDLEMVLIFFLAELHPRAKRARGRSPIAKKMW